MLQLQALFILLHELEEHNTLNKKEEEEENKFAINNNKVNITRWPFRHRCIRSSTQMRVLPSQKENKEKKADITTGITMMVAPR